METTKPNPTSIAVGGNFEGNIIVGDNNFAVNKNYGTIVYNQAPPRVQARSMAPKPPRRPRGFIGRAKELAQLEELITKNEPILLYGQPGLGKTALAKQATNGSAATSEPNGVVFIEGIDQDGAVLGFNDLIQRMFDALFESEPQLKVSLEVARTYLTNVRPFVFLSSTSLSPSQLDNLADLFPNTPIMVEMEQTPGSEAFDPLPLKPLQRSDSVTLLADRSGITVDVAQQPTLEEIAELLGDTPAALVIIGNAIHEQRLNLPDVPNRLRAITSEIKDPVKAAMHRAYVLVIATLSDDERSMLVQTGAAPGISVDRKWLESVCGGSTVGEKLEALQLLQANSPRLRLISGIRDMALQGQDEAQAKDRLLSHLVSEMQNKAGDFEFIADELGNLLGLLNWAAQQKRWEEVLAIAKALDPFLTLRGLWDAWKSILDHALQAARELGDRAAEAWALHQIGTWQIGQGDFSAAQKSLQQARDMRQSLGDETGTAFSQHNLDFLSTTVAPQPQKPLPPKRNRWPWIVGSIIVASLLILFFGNAFGLHLPFSPLLQPTSTPPLTATLVASDTPQSTETAASIPVTGLQVTETPIPSDTPTPTNLGQAITPSVTFTPTITSSPTPTFVPMMNVTVATHNYCFYGPGRFYLSFTGLIQSQPIQSLGRTDAGDWIRIQFPSSQDVTKDSICWFEAKYINFGGNDLMSLEPVYPEKAPLVISQNPVGYPAPQHVSATRSGDQVTITWNSVLLIPEKMRGDAVLTSPTYLVEAWVCQAGQIVFKPIGYYPLSQTATPAPDFKASVTVTDQSGCAQPSHGRVFLAEVHGYIGPAPIIPWP